jgi:hypothetical protein
MDIHLQFYLKNTTKNHGIFQLEKPINKTPPIGIFASYPT